MLRDLASAWCNEILCVCVCVQMGRGVASAVFAAMTAMDVTNTTRQCFAVAVCVVWAGAGLYVGSQSERVAA